MSQTARVLAAVDAAQRETKRWARVEVVASATNLHPSRVRSTLEAAAKRGLVKPRIGSGLRPMADCWVILPAGRAALERGTLEPGVTQLADDDLRTRAWRAMRLQRKFTADTVLNIILQAPADNYHSAYVRLCRYLCQLEAVRVVTVVQRTRNGGKRYLLIEDLGQLAPVPRPAKAAVYDPNAGRLVERPRAAALLDAIVAREEERRA